MTEKIFIGEFPHPEPLRRVIDDVTCADETSSLEALIAAAVVNNKTSQRITKTARRLVRKMRKTGVGTGGIDAFMYEYGLSSQEGVVLMCLAEALLRIPDAETANRLIRDKIGDGDWGSHLWHSGSLFVNASTWALMMTGSIVSLDNLKGAGDLSTFLGNMVAKSGEPIIRQAMIQAMRILGGQFILGRTIEEALKKSSVSEAMGYRYSYDMLGEAAHTADDARHYFENYARAIVAIGEKSAAGGVVHGPGVSVKLSALHPRYEFSQRARIMDELVPRVKELALMAAEVNIGLCLDSEESDRLGLWLDVFAAVFADTQLCRWDGLGLAVQAYQKRAPFVIDWLADLARHHKRRICLRLVKGAYWDSEIKHAQKQGLHGYTVFTRKLATDVSYLACAQKVLAAGDAFFPQFATHNAHTLAAVMEMAGKRRNFEFQRLHGMGESLHDQIVRRNDKNNGNKKKDNRKKVACRIYAPVGSHDDLLSYLVRRLLENGANTSFVNRMADKKALIGDVIADPVTQATALKVKPHSRIPLPADLYGDARRNAKGIDLSDPTALRCLKNSMEANCRPWLAAVNMDGEGGRGANERSILNPADNRQCVGSVINATDNDIDVAMERAQNAFESWDETPAAERAACLERGADLLEENMAEFMALAVVEAGKTIADALSEVREAVDFCRYYAERARVDFSTPQNMPGPTGETNQLSLCGRGVFACISPWNFPLAIFIGQLSAALAAGNTVVAKPAEQTPLIAARATAILHQAGIPDTALNLLYGDGGFVGTSLVDDLRVSGVAFTGSMQTARRINQALANRQGAIIPLIAETGGQNVMIVDSSALPEQVVEDVVSSAFRSAGQRCSALRVLFVQKDIADKLLPMLAGATDELNVGDPALLSTDVGPVIDDHALEMLEKHARRMDRQGKLLCRARLTDACDHGSFFAPCAYAIDRMDILEGEVFGPILHVITYDADRLDDVIEAVNNTGFGLTLGVHSRVDATARYIQKHLHVGNTYVNRDMTGAVVGVQPFGGEGLSGTGYKAGGPRYLHHFAIERTICVNTSAAGGNAALMSLVD